MMSRATASASSLFLLHRRASQYSLRTSAAIDTSSGKSGRRHGLSIGRGMTGFPRHVKRDPTEGHSPPNRRKRRAPRHASVLADRQWQSEPRRSPPWQLRSQQAEGLSSRVLGRGRSSSAPDLWPRLLGSRRLRPRLCRRTARKAFVPWYRRYVCIGDTIVQ